MGGWLVKYPRYYWLILAEGHLTRIRLAVMLRTIAMLLLRGKLRLPQCR
jgi:hypothetical protein